jgi:phosphopantothenate synthetase
MLTEKAIVGAFKGVCRSPAAGLITQTLGYCFDYGVGSEANYNCS